MHTVKHKAKDTCFRVIKKRKKGKKKQGVMWGSLEQLEEEEKRAESALPSAMASFLCQLHKPGGTEVLRVVGGIYPFQPHIQFTPKNAQIHTRRAQASEQTGLQRGEITPNQRLCCCASVSVALSGQTKSQQRGSACLKTTRTKYLSEIYNFRKCSWNSQE